MIRVAISCSCGSTERTAALRRSSDACIRSSSRSGVDDCVPGGVFTDRNSARLRVLASVGAWPPPQGSSSVLAARRDIAPYVPLLGRTQTDDESFSANREDGTKLLLSHTTSI